MNINPNEKQVQEERIKILLARWIKKKTDLNKAVLAGKKKETNSNETRGNIQKNI
jgi:hypothetical protein